MLTSPKPVPVSLIAKQFGMAQSARIVLQDSTPLANSLEWELGTRYFACRGSFAFCAEHVPVCLPESLSCCWAESCG
jgi:hypothetical protein